MPRILLSFSTQHGFSLVAEEGIEVVCVDHRAPRDRLYVTQGAATPEDFDVICDRAIRGEAPDFKLK
jgi:hypothetical protein